MLGAKEILVGRVNVFGTRYVINARLIDVELGVIQGEREVTCEPCTPSDLQESVMLLKQVLVK